MQTLNPVLATAVMDEIAAHAETAAARAEARRAGDHSRFGGLRRRVAARRGRSPVAMPSPHVPARASRA